MKIGDEYSSQKKSRNNERKLYGKSNKEQKRSERNKNEANERVNRRIIVQYIELSMSNRFDEAELIHMLVSN